MKNIIRTRNSTVKFLNFTLNIKIYVKFKKFLSKRETLFVSLLISLDRKFANNALTHYFNFPTKFTNDTISTHSLKHAFIHACTKFEALLYLSFMILSLRAGTYRLTVLIPHHPIFTQLLQSNGRDGLPVCPSGLLYLRPTLSVQHLKGKQVYRIRPTTLTS